MKQILPFLLLSFGCSVRAQTDLPGPIRALPEIDHSAANGVCSWNAAQTKKACVTSANGNVFDWNIAISDTGYTFDNLIISQSVRPSSDLTYNLGDCASSATCPSGSGAFGYAGIFTRTIYNYGASPFAIYSDTTQISLDTHGAQPIQFYTTNTLRGQFLSGGAFEVENLGGSGNRCPHVNNSGTFSLTGSDCIDPTVTNTFTATQNVHSLLPTTDLTYSLGDCAMSATCPSGSGAKEWAIIHTQEVANYGANVLSLYSDVNWIALATGSAGQAIAFYTNNILRGGWDDLGLTDAVLGGSGTRCVQTDNAGRLGKASAGCGTSSGTVTNIATTSPITGGPITTTGTIACATCAVTNADNNFSTTQTTHSVLPASDVTYNSGDTTHNWAGVFANTIYDYAAGTALGLYANSSAGGVGIAISTGTSADIAFYPNLGNSFTLKAAGTVRLNNLAGGGNRCLQVDNNGDITAHAAGTC